MRVKRQALKMASDFFHLLDVRPLALVACPYHGLCHLVLDEGSLPDLGIFFNLFASKRDVWDLLAQPTAFFAALGVQAREHLVLFLRLVHYGGKRTEGALFKPVKTGLEDVSSRHKTFVKMVKAKQATLLKIYLIDQIVSKGWMAGACNDVIMSCIVSFPSWGKIMVAVCLY